MTECDYRGAGLTDQCRLRACRQASNFQRDGAFAGSVSKTVDHSLGQMAVVQIQSDLQPGGVALLAIGLHLEQ